MKIFFLILVLPLFASHIALADRDPILEASRKLTKEIRDNGKAFANLKELTAMGHRLSGTVGAERAIHWAKKKMESYQFDKVWLQEVQVPKWTRGTTEKAIVTTPESPVALTITALGNSVGTTGVEAEVIEVQSLDEVKQLGEAGVKGKIVFYNRPLDSSLEDTFEAYGGAVDQRSSGPSHAAKYGAVAALVRSLTTLSDDDHPHTGFTGYKNGVRKIPAAALSTRSANLLSRLIKEQGHVKVRLELSAKQEAPVTSYNVIGEIQGSALPKEYVVVGGHLDSWDLAQGAHDDGAGVVQSIEVLRAMKAVGLKPKRTIRAVLFMTEEFGGIGANEYAKQAKLKGENHLAAMESDRGGYAPVGFSVDASDDVLNAVKGFKEYLNEVGAGQITSGGSGTDVEPLDELGVATFEFVPVSTHYFDLHHSSLDRIDAVVPAELDAGAAAMGVFTYVVSEKGLPKNRRPPKNRK